LAGYVSEHSAYHHGEASLQNTIINMAQDFVGSNNVPLLVPSGQFGTRIMGGKDHSSPRYIFTKLQQYTTHFFHETDSALLKHLEDDGMKIEPEWYAPPIPLVLVNGTDGIGTGWSTKVPAHNPKDVVRCVRAAIRAGTSDEGLEEAELPDIKPWYNGFKGVIREKTEGQFETIGCLEKGTKKHTIVITELPIGTWTEDYKEWLETQAQDSKKTGIKSVKNNSTESEVCFTITLQTDASRCKLI
jgi:DNA topoisomerase-2